MLQAAGMVVTNTLYKNPPPHLVGKEQMSWSDYTWDEDSISHITALGAFLDNLMEGADILNRYE